MGEPLTDDLADCGPYFDGVLGCTTGDIDIPLFVVNDKSAAAIETADNLFRSDVDTVPFNAMDLDFVFVGCLLNRGLTGLLSELPAGINLPILDTVYKFLLDFVRRQSATAVTSAACDVIVTVKGMADMDGEWCQARLEALQEGHSDADKNICPFVPNRVQSCDLSRWKHVTQVSFAARAPSLTDTGPPSVVAVIDDFAGTGISLS